MLPMLRTVVHIAALALLACRAAGAPLVVDPLSGDDAAPGTEARPLRTVSAALARIPDPLTRSATITLRPGTYASTGANGMPPGRLDLAVRMRPGVSVVIEGAVTAGGTMPVLAWEGGECMVNAAEGEWRLHNLQVGSGSVRQRRGVAVTGPGVVTLDNVTFRTRSQSDAAIYAHRGGRALLRGAIRINEEFHDAVPAGDTFAGIIATDHGSVAFAAREGASLDMGNGSLSCSYYGVIELGCASVRITNWTQQSNCLAVNNSGRIDLHSTPVRLAARVPRNTPIGLEHDGHVLAEGARITIETGNDHAIVLQKVSSLTCNEIDVRGSCRWTVSAMSGSVFVGGFVGSVAGLEADSGAHITVESVRTPPSGPVDARRGGTVMLPGTRGG